MEGLATPTTPYGAHWTNNPSPYTKKYYKKVLQWKLIQKITKTAYLDH